MIIDKVPVELGFHKVDDVVAMLKKHTAQKPIFDLQQVVDDLDLWQVAKNARLGVVVKNDKGEYYKIGSIYAVLPTPRDLEVLKYEVKQTYKRVSGQSVEPEKKVKTVTTTVDDLDGTNPQPRRQKKNTTKYGEQMKSGKLTNQQLEGNV